tara:strand:- start:1087 stop:1752 length:666 start_codon:yes stop_codon:yes gene_type:complete
MISPLLSATDTTIQPEATKKSALGKDEFMKLLVAQMSAQDPLDPMDNADFSAQLAQFSALEQMQNVNKNIEDLVQLQTSFNNNMSIDLIDKLVTVPGNNLTISEGKPDTVSYELGKEAKSVSIKMYDSSNNLVASVLKGAKTAGLHEYTWDGKDLTGKVLPDGDYTFKVSAVDSADLPVVTRTHQNSKVTGVVFEDGVSYVVTGNDNKIDVKDITSVNSSL